MGKQNGIVGSGKGQYYVYTLAYSDGQVFYVGKGQGRRVYQHETEARSGCNCSKCQIIRKIWASGMQVLKNIIFETNEEQKALEQEAQLINQYDGSLLANILSNRSKGYNVVDKERIRNAILKGKTIQGLPMVSTKEMLVAYGVKASLLSYCLNSANVIRHQFPFLLDTRWYILRSDVERVLHFLIGE